MMPDPSILAKITPQTTVVVWASDRSLHHEVPGFSTVDYLLDGLVRKHISNQENADQVNFVHTLFGQNFWVAYINVNSKNENFISGLTTLIPEGKREYLVVLNSQLIPSALDQKLDKHFGFVEKL
jgi:hypothetical protein